MAYELCPSNKSICMRKDQRGQRSGANKQEGSGIKPVISSENLEGAEHLRKKITKDGDQPAG
jgi:hypothetical protein